MPVDLVQMLIGFVHWLARVTAKYVPDAESLSIFMRDQAQGGVERCRALYDMIPKDTSPIKRAVHVIQGNIRMQKLPAVFLFLVASIVVLVMVPYWMIGLGFLYQSGGSDTTAKEAAVERKLRRKEKSSSKVQRRSLNEPLRAGPGEMPRTARKLIYPKEGLASAAHVRECLSIDSPGLRSALGIARAPPQRPETGLRLDIDPEAELQSDGEILYPGAYSHSHSQSRSHSHSSAYSHGRARARADMQKQGPGQGAHRQHEQEQEQDIEDSETEVEAEAEPNTELLQEQQQQQQQQQVQVLESKEDDEGTYTGATNVRTGAREGYGEMLYKDGSVYRGHWKGDRAHGTGTLDGENVYGKVNDPENSNNQSIRYSYCGEWSNGVPVGSGTTKYEDGSIFYGPVSDVLYGRSDDNLPIGKYESVPLHAPVSVPGVKVSTPLRTKYGAGACAGAGAGAIVPVPEADEGDVLGILPYTYEGGLLAPLIADADDSTIDSRTIVRSIDNALTRTSYMYYSAELDGCFSGVNEDIETAVAAGNVIAYPRSIVRAAQSLHAYGTGRMQWSNGDYYSGSFFRNLRHGHGTYVCMKRDKSSRILVKDDRRNKGGKNIATSWSSGSPLGDVIKTESVKSIYIGSWEFDHMHGSGKLTVYTAAVSKSSGNIASSTARKAAVAALLASSQNSLLKRINSGISAIDNNISQLTASLPIIDIGINTKKPCKIYEGQFHAGMRHGAGVLTFPSGGVYSGEWWLDKRCGIGEYVFPSGDVYRGDFKNDCRDGKGMMKYSNGNTYQGEWREDLRTNGTLITAATGAVYAGSFDREGRKSGWGVHTWATGSRYEGWWSEDVAQGYGVYYRISAHSTPLKTGDGADSDEDSSHPSPSPFSPPLSPATPLLPESPKKTRYEHVYKGMWVKNKKHTTVSKTSSKSSKSSSNSSSKAGMTDADGNKIDPTVATETYANGDIYAGQFTRGRRTGIGTYTYAADGRTECGLFADGVFQGAVVEQDEVVDPGPQVGFWGRIFA